METPQLFGAFHIAALIIAVIAAAAAAFCVSCNISDKEALRCGEHIEKNGRDPAGSEAEQELVRVLAACGWVLAVMELYKQLFL